MKYAIIFIAALFFSCESQDVVTKIVVPPSGDINLSFDASLKTINEGQDVNVSLSFNRATVESGSIIITYTSDSAVYEEQFTSIPAFTNKELIIDYPIGTDSISFEIQTFVDDNTENEFIEFSVTESPASIKISSNATFKLNIEDQTQGPDNNPSEKDSLTVVTWNIEHFPKNGINTINAIRDIVLTMDADIIALQEMESIDDFNTLVDAIDGWEGEIYDVRGKLELAYLYKTSEITSFSALSVIFPDDSYAFPREPVVVKATHSNGLEFTMINIHLKCCGLTGSDEANRRENAAKDLQEYIKNNLGSDNVIVVGDWNDDMEDGPFDNFLSDSENFVFADYDIATGSSTNWSYPSWPSHLDHILITNELTDNYVSSEVLKLDQTTSNYDSNVSDHRPLTATFSNN